MWSPSAFALSKSSPGTAVGGIALTAAAASDPSGGTVRPTRKQAAACRPAKAKTLSPRTSSKPCTRALSANSCSAPSDKPTMQRWPRRDTEGPAASSVSSNFGHSRAADRCTSQPSTGRPARSPSSTNCKATTGASRGGVSTTARGSAQPRPWLSEGPIIEPMSRMRGCSACEEAHLFVDEYSATLATSSIPGLSSHCRRGGISAPPAAADCSPRWMSSHTRPKSRMPGSAPRSSRMAAVTPANSW
mmetsp:Transcript_162028/g.519512  ORF Transcript_162028/g.519512 Transcript_162028/m.519512 type:complete len:246 (-) Transcript_162028:663-1400(-)